MNKIGILLALITCLLYSCSDKPANGDKSQNNTAAKKDSVNKENSGVSYAKDSVYLVNLLKKLGKKPQVFTFDAVEGTSISCVEGTKIKIDKNSFVEAQTGKPVTGKVNFSVKEYYKPADMIIAGLSTTSDNKLLETGGMVYLEATQNGRKLKLAEGNTFEISFNGNEQRKGMQLFNGTHTGDHINWIPDTVPLVKGMDDEGYGDDYGMVNRNQNKTIRKKTATEKAAESAYNVFRSRQLGWINCDRFNNVINKIDFVVKAVGETHLVFKNIKAIMSSYSHGETCIFSKIPDNEPVTIVSYKCVDNKIYLASKSCITQATNQESLDYVQIDENKLKKELEERLKF